MDAKRDAIRAALRDAGGTNEVLGLCEASVESIPAHDRETALLGACVLPFETILTTTMFTPLRRRNPTGPHAFTLYLRGRAMGRAIRAGNAEEWGDLG